jgi:hypothetical protein
MEIFLIIIAFVSFLIYIRNLEIRLKVVQAFVGGYWRFLSLNKEEDEKILAHFVEEEISESCSFEYYKKLAKNKKLFHTEKGDNVGLWRMWEIVNRKMCEEIKKIENKK